MERRPKDVSKDFERALKNKDHKYILRLYVSGVALKSAKAVSNVKRICEEHLQGRFELEVIDVYRKPGMVKRNRIVAMPTLIKELPPPLRRVVGDMADKERVLAGLDLVEKE